MKIIRSIHSLRKELDQTRKKGQRIGFVPTMGALHEGHLSLVRKCRRENNVVVLSIFVNPIQFGPKEDLRKYPRPEKKDHLLAKKENVDIIFHPSGKMIYPSGFLTFIDVDRLGEGLCGQFRPGHFRGVTTVVGKLLNIVQPHTLYLGQKDAQQAVILNKMVEDLNIPVKIRVCPIIREKDGLALSSRNAYLSVQERAEAPVLYQALKKARTAIHNGRQSPRVIIREIKKEIAKAGHSRIEYIHCVDVKTLSPVKKIQGTIMIALAVYFGRTRLIDNIVVQVS